MNMKETIIVENVDVKLLKEQRDDLVTILGTNMCLNTPQLDTLVELINLLDEMLGNSSDNENNDYEEENN